MFIIIFLYIPLHITLYHPLYFAFKFRYRVAIVPSWSFMLTSTEQMWWVNQAQAVLQDGTGGWALAPWWPRLPLAMNTRKLLIDWKVEQEQESKEENITVIRQPNHSLFINSLFIIQTFQTWSSWNYLGNMILYIYYPTHEAKTVTDSVNHETFCLGLFVCFKYQIYELD